MTNRQNRQNPALVDTSRAQTRLEFQSDLIRSAYFLCLIMLHLPLWLNGPRCFIHLLMFCSVRMRRAPENFKLNLHARALIARRVSASQFHSGGLRNHSSTSDSRFVTKTRRSLTVMNAHTRTEINLTQTQKEFPLFPSYSNT